jgi:hypothetical protein
MAGCYALAKALELGDRALAAVVSTGGHPWKHLAGAVGILCYLHVIRYRKQLSVVHDIVGSRSPT